jgi:hypothetical protein
MRRFAIAVAGTMLALVVPTSSASAETAFGSALDHAANFIAYINGWDQNVRTSTRYHGPTGLKR